MSNGKNIVIIKGGLTCSCPIHGQVFSAMDIVKPCDRLAEYANGKKLVHGQVAAAWTDAEPKRLNPAKDTPGREFRNPEEKDKAIRLVESDIDSSREKIVERDVPEEKTDNSANEYFDEEVEAEAAELLKKNKQTIKKRLNDGAVGRDVLAAAVKMANANGLTDKEELLLDYIEEKLAKAGKG